MLPSDRSHVRPWGLAGVGCRAPVVRLKRQRTVWALGPAILMLAWGLARGQPVGPDGVSCGDCHRTEGAEFAASVHTRGGLNCQACHGGENRYRIEAALVEQSRQWLGPDAKRGSTEPTFRFDHGPRFQGKPARREIPERCGGCHSDVAAMNPYGLPTDQLAQYRLSGHGRALFEKDDDRAAVCTDCHGRHAIQPADDPTSPVHATNVPAMCARCHSDARHMADSQLSTRVVEEYRRSVHGEGLLELQDTAMPHCATCHGSHSAVPPGFRDVGHVCGRCHQQEEQHFLASPHAKFPLFPRCVGCHTRSVDRRDHLIGRVAASPEALRRAYATVRQAMPAAEEGEQRFQQEFAARREPPVQHFENICRRCHSPGQQTGHRAFLGGLDDVALGAGGELYQLVRQAELGYAATAERVGQVGRGVLLVTEEALLAEQMRTQLVGLGPLQHTLNVEKLREAKGELDGLADQIHAALDVKLRNLRWRYWTLVPMWVFILIFAGALWTKYKRLKEALVKPMVD